MIERQYHVTYHRALIGYLPISNQTGVGVVRYLSIDRFRNPTWLSGRQQQLIAVYVIIGNFYYEYQGAGG